MSDKSDNEYDSESDANSEIDEEYENKVVEDPDPDVDQEDDESDGDVDGEVDGDVDDESDTEDASEMMDENDTDSDDDEDADDGNYLQKFGKDIHKKIIQDYHPELAVHNYEEILALCEISRDESGEIVDPLHRTVPYVTRYEKARIIGERACQLNSGATPFIEVDKDIIDGETIAIKEFEQKRIPFIVQRPLSNGGCEYWKLKDLELIC